MKTYFDKVQQVIDLLNEKGINYLILRNFESLLDDQIYVGGHEDIDFLCENSKEVIDVLGALSNRKHPDYAHYHIFVAGNRVNLDLRSIGDGYYCKKWQTDMLCRKKKHQNFYVMSDEDYYYSLIYHAIIQKKSFTQEYHERLTNMAEELGIKLKCTTESCFIQCLESYMSQNGYKYVYTKDPSIPLRFNMVNRRMIMPEVKRIVNRFYFKMHQKVYSIICRIYQFVFRK